MNIPQALQASFDLYWQRFTESCEPELLNDIKNRLEKNHAGQQLLHCWVGSEFAAELCIKYPAWLLDLLFGDGILAEKSQEDYQREIRQQLLNVTTEEELHRQLRLFRNRAMLRIIWRDFNRIASTQQTVMELTFLADVCVQQALQFLHQQLSRSLGVPRNEQSEEQLMLVMAMGKHGAHELNLSSDIDLIFVYPDEGETDHAENPVSNHEFFIKLGQKLIRTLDQHTADGFVFRVDMALRPNGESGPLVGSFDMLEQYYQSQGRTWERYAMIKARIITGNDREAEILMKILRSFTYRRYIDFSVIESLREMKALISREEKRKGYQDNIKLGAGGIREIEFIAQAFQLIRGGRELDFQQRELLNILPLLSQKQLLSEAVIKELTQAYLFMRDTEHVLQGFQDKQTQQLPALPSEQERIAYLMGFDSWSLFYVALQIHRDVVSKHFKQIAAFEDEEVHQQLESKTSPTQEEWLLDLWEVQDENEKINLAKSHLQAYPAEKVVEAVRSLHQLQHSRALLSLQAESRHRLDVFMPRMLQEVLHASSPAETLLRILPFVHAVLRRSAYLVLLNENPNALKQLVMLSAASPWIAEELAMHPVLLDELLDERTLYLIPERQKMTDALRQEVIRIPLDDLEAQMEVLRYFKQAHRLRVAACEVTGRLPLMKVSDYLTFLAEAILNHALAVAWHAMTSKYGLPTREDGSVCDPSFIIVGYGKLGGLELGHNSDLDVVFIHGADPLGYTKHPDTSIDNATFYARLGQRIIHILESRTHSGQLYEMDTALRPSGNSGLLVTSIEAFGKYQREQAWIWEHQALVRARVVAGCPVLAKSFEQIRQEVLSRQRDLSTLKSSIVEMREKMIKHLSSGVTDVFDLKQDRGGIIDIEFLVQYGVLAWAHDHPQLLRWPDNIRILEELGAACLLSSQEAQQLIDIYKMLRCAAHQHALQLTGGRVEGSQFQSERRFVTTCWQRLLG